MHSNAMANVIGINSGQLAGYLGDRKKILAGHPLPASIFFANQSTETGQTVPLVYLVISPNARELPAGITTTFTSLPNLS